MWIFGFPGVDYPRKTYYVIDSRELIFFDSENDQVPRKFWIFIGICRISARFRMALPDETRVQFSAKNGIKSRFYFFKISIIFSENNYFKFKNVEFLEND